MFQDGIWSVCFNVVVCARIQRKEKKKELRKKKEEEKESVKKEENKKGSHQILWSEMEGRSIVLKKKRWKKNWMEIPKRVDIPTNLENTSYYSPLPIFISFPLLLPYITS